MDQDARKLMWTFIFVHLISFACAQSKWVPTFQQPLNASSAATRHASTISDYLSFTVPIRGRTASCEAQLSYFTFRVNSKGVIDSVNVEGNLNIDATNAVKNNIQSSSGKWLLPRQTRPEDSCWFVFLYYDGGKTRGCAEQTLVLRNQIERLVSLYSQTENTVDTSGRIILPPNKYRPAPEK